MKKLLAAFLAFSLLLSSAALAETAREESAPLTREELEMYLDGLGRAALLDEALTVESAEDGYTYAHFSGGSLEIADETLTESTAVVGAWLAPGQADPRGLSLGSTLEEVLLAYPNDNPQLGGSYFDAALYIAGDKPEVAAGFLLRDGQHVTEIEQTVYSWQAEGVALWGVTYLMDQGTVMGIYIGSDDLMEEDQALESIQEISEMQEVSEYFAYPESVDGDALAMFGREDLNLLIDGQVTVDFLDLTAEAAMEAFGPAPVDEWNEDSDGTFLRLLQWDGVSLLLHCDAQKHFLAVDSLTVNDDVLEGPRGVRVGDLMDHVLFRFRHGDVFAADDTLLLYGDGTAAPYGVLSYTPDSAEVTYALSLEDGRAVVWHMTFVSGAMQTMTMLLR